MSIHVAVFEPHYHLFKFEVSHDRDFNFLANKCLNAYLHKAGKVCTSTSFGQLQKYSVDQPDCIVPNVWMQNALLLPDIFRVHQSITWPVVDHSMIACILHLQLAHTILLSLFHTRLARPSFLITYISLSNHTIVEVDVENQTDYH
jgi:hypothetical protein